MLGNRRVDTNPEVRLRSALHRRGLRFRKDFLLRLPDGVRARPDIVFTRAHVVVHSHGCFWHRCPLHATDPKANADYWGPKLAQNVERDERIDAALRADGWTVIRVWEHEDAGEAALQIERVVRAASNPNYGDRCPTGEVAG
jgi:DNA mismatch endonuclease, patch repair protein